MGNELQVMKWNIAICDDEKAIGEQINELIVKEKPGVCPELYETGDGLLAAGKRRKSGSILRGRISRWNSLAAGSYWYTAREDILCSCIR